MKKFKLGPSVILLLLVCLLTKNILLLINCFSALFLHEIAHLWIAKSKGYSLKLVKLDIFGLYIELNETIDDKDQFAINIAGPVFNLLLCVLCLATYWLIPNSFYYLNTFCFANLILAIFNLLPVYPLDGGKIFRGIIKSNKAYKILDIVVRFTLAILLICAFIISCFNMPNFLLLILALFFITSKGKQTPTMSIFKFRQNKSFDKVVILKVEETEILFDLIKKIKNYHYTIFYVPSVHKYYDEDNIIELSLKYPLTSTLKQIN